MPLRQNRIRLLPFENCDSAMKTGRFNIRRGLTVALISLSTAMAAAPAQALVPYIYLPTKEELTGSAIGIGRTAAQLLQLGSPGKLHNWRPWPSASTRTTNASGQSWRKPSCAAISWKRPADPWRKQKNSIRAKRASGLQKQLWHCGRNVLTKPFP